MKRDKDNKNRFKKFLLKFNKEKSGITLIGLVITIIILVIIIAISISAITGANGLFGRDEEAAEKTRVATIQEQAELLKKAWMIDKGVSGGELSKYEFAQVIAEDTNYFNGWKDNNDGTVSDANDTYTISINDNLEISVNKEQYELTNDIEIIARIEENDTNSRILHIEYNFKDDLMQLKSLINRNIGGNFNDEGEREYYEQYYSSSYNSYGEYLLNLASWNGIDTSNLDISNCVDTNFQVVLSVKCGNNLIPSIPNEKDKYMLFANKEYQIIASTGGQRAIKVVNLNQGEYAQFRIQDEEKFSKISTSSYVSKDSTPITVPLPEGFYAPLDSSTNINTVENGLVITDEVDEEGYSVGNEFVWVPVPFFSEFVRNSSYYRYGGHLVNSNPEYGDMYEPLPDGNSNNTEIEKMFKSVKDHGGFYIARFEAGTISNGVGLRGAPLSKRSTNAYNNIRWYESVQAARNMYPEHSTLCYGVQWDATLNWLSEEDSLNAFFYDSRGIGNYGVGNISEEGSLKCTGLKNYKTKNIYDMAGNVGEWTMEEVYESKRMIRGGCYTDSGYYNLTSITGGDNRAESSMWDGFGFRVTLFV